MTGKHPPLIWTRLSIMMFLQFFIWGGWGFALGGYATETLGFSGGQLGWLYAVPALGAIISPLFIGMIADRFFATERVLFILHLVSGAALIGAGFSASFPLLMTCMMIHGLLFMPSIALINSLAFRHIPDADKFPRIAVFGTIGWIIAVLAASVFLGGTKTPNFLFQSGAASVVLALYCLTLPHTPPKGAEAGGDVFGLKALTLLKDPMFLFFILCVSLFSIPACGYFFALLSPMLEQRGYPAPLALTTLNQFAEIIFMFAMPLFVAKLGLRKVLVIGMLAWVVRYFIFMSPMFPMALLGLVLHGFCYSFFYVGAYMYVDRRAPEELKASAQSLLAFLLLGIGWFAGAKMAGFMVDYYPPLVPNASKVVAVQVNEEPAEGEQGGRVSVTLAKDDQPAEVIASVEDGTVSVEEKVTPLPPWNDPNAATSVWRYLDLSGTVKKLITPPPADEVLKELVSQIDKDGDEKVSREELQNVADEGLTVNGEKFSKDRLMEIFGIQPPDMSEKLDEDGDGKITMADVKQIPDEGVQLGTTTYTRDEMMGAFRRVARIDKPDIADEKIVLTRNQWLSAKANQWSPIWMWQGIVLAIILLAFLVGFRDAPEETKEEEEPAESGEGEATAAATDEPTASGEDTPA
jgi:nucleoside transporter